MGGDLVYQGRIRERERGSGRGGEEKKERKEEVRKRGRGLINQKLLHEPEQNHNTHRQSMIGF